MRRRTQLSAEERALWAHVAQSIRPLPGRIMPKLEALPVARTEAKLDGLSIGSALEPVQKPGIKPLVPLERRMRQRVTRGQSPIDGVLDLHGMRQDEAHRALLNFIHRKVHEGASVVMVITGKGGTLSSDGRGVATTDGRGVPTMDHRGVLKRLVPHWLSDPGQRRYVLGFEDAAQHHGGTGALYVRLRRLRDGSGLL
jgi:DNA-nicking Smr family endonuclease